MKLQAKPLEILTLVLMGLIVLTPIYIDSDFFYPYIFSKTLAFRVLVEILFVVWLGWLYLRRDFRIKIDWMTITFIALVLAMLVSSIFGVNFQFSLWGNVERSEGLILWFHLLAFFLVLRNFDWTEKRWLYVMDAFFAAAQVVAVLGFLQYLGVEYINNTAIEDARISSTIGNAAYLAGYMLFASFFGLYLLVSRRHKMLAIYYIPAILLDLFVMAQTGTRGAFVAAIISGLAFIIFNVFRLNNKKIKMYVTVAGLVILAILALVYVNKDSNFVQNSLALRRLTSISLTERTAQTRFMAWGSAWSGFLDRPILGYGQENFGVVFNKYFNPGIYSHAGSQVWFDRAHNIFLDHLVTGGIVGLVLYAILIFGSIITILKKVLVGPQENATQNKWTDQILFFGMLAFLIQGLLVFEALVTYMPLLIIIAIIATQYIKPKKEIYKSKAGLIALIVVGLAMIPVMYRVNIKEARANLDFIDALRTENIDIPLAIEKYQNVIAKNTSGKQEFRLHFAEFVDDLVVNKRVVPYDAVRYVDLVDAELDKRIVENPYDTANYLLYMRHLNYTYVLDQNRLYKVFDLGEQALDKSPTRPHIYYELGYAALYLYQWFADNNDIEQAAQYQIKTKEYFDRAIDLSPTVMESYVNAIMAMLATHQPEAVQSYVNQMNARFINYKREEPLNRVANSAVSAGEYEWALQAYQWLVEIDNQNPDYRVGVALSHAYLGDDAAAIAEAEKIRADFGDPYSSQAEAFIVKVRNGEFK